MLTRKVYIPIVLCLVLLAIGFLTLRSDVPDELIKVYKTVEPLPKSEVKVSPVGDTSQGGHFHTDGTFHAEPHESVVVIEETPRINLPNLRGQSYWRGFLNMISIVQKVRKTFTRF